LLRSPTALLGALIAGAILSNVVMLGTYFDVPGTGIAIGLSLIACVLILPEAKRLFSLHVAGNADFPSQATGHEWTPLRRVLFRFAFLYIPIYCALSEPLVVIIGSPQGAFFHPFGQWLAYRILQIGRQHDYYNVVAVVLAPMLSAIGAAAWSLVDRHRRE